MTAPELPAAGPCPGAGMEPQGYPIGAVKEGEGRTPSPAHIFTGCLVTVAVDADRSFLTAMPDRVSVKVRRDPCGPCNRGAKDAKPEMAGRVRSASNLSGMVSDTGALMGHGKLKGLVRGGPCQQARSPRQPHRGARNVPVHKGDSNGNRKKEGYRTAQGG